MYRRLSSSHDSMNYGSSCAQRFVVMRLWMRSLLDVPFHLSTSTAVAHPSVIDVNMSSLISTALKPVQLSKVFKIVFIFRWVISLPYIRHSFTSPLTMFVTAGIMKFLVTSLLYGVGRYWYSIRSIKPVLTSVVKKRTQVFSDQRVFASDSLTHLTVSYILPSEQSLCSDLTTRNRNCLDFEILSSKKPRDIN